MSPGRQIRFWAIGFALFVALLWLLADALLPFVVGLAIAYLLDPFVDRLESLRLPRWLATTLVLLSFTVALTAFVLLLLPLVQAQVAQLVEVLPGYANRLRAQVEPVIERFLHDLSAEDMERLRTAAGQYAGDVAGWVAQVLKGVLSGGIAFFDVLSVIFITPVVAFYLLRDWDLLVATVDGWLPRRHAETIRAQTREVDETLAGFLRGQATVCLALGVFYAVALSMAGLHFGLVIGLLAGFLSFVPYVGSLFGFVSSVGLALMQFEEPWRVVVVAVIFLVGQAVEGNVLTPKLVGERVGLHPVWVIFALLAGGSLFGFVGVLLAVPVAAVIGVLTRFALRQYLDSPLYTGTTP